MSKFAPYAHFGGWALSCFDAGVNFELLTPTSRQAFEVLVSLASWKGSFQEFVQYGRKHGTAYEYLCSSVWSPDLLEQEDEYEAFTWSCRHGLLRTAQWIRKVWQDMAHTVVDKHCFIDVCGRGLLNIAQWLVDTNWLTVTLVTAEAAFVQACMRGHLTVAQWLKSTWPNIDHRMFQDSIFVLTCEHGHLDVAQWLKRRWPDIDHQSLNCSAYLYACCEGHLQVVKWLNETWPDLNFDTEDSGLYLAGLNGHLCTVKWVLAHRPKAPFQPLYLCDMFCNSSSKGRLATLQLLHANFETNLLDPTYTYALAYDNACANGHLVVVQWLVANFFPRFINKKDIELGFMRAFASNSLHVSNWLSDTFPEVKRLEYNES